MSLSCDYEYDDPDWFYTPQEVAPLNTRRSRKCHSCKEKIKVGDDAKAFVRYRYPNYDSIEERIYGEGGEVPMATWYLCDRCGGLYESLDGLGFCYLLDQDLRETCKEYAQMQRDAGIFKGQMVIKATGSTS